MGNEEVDEEEEDEESNREHLSPDLEERIPRASAERSAVSVDTQARDAIVVAFESEDKLALEGVPDAAVVVIIASKEEAARDGESNAGDADKNAVTAVSHELTIRAEIPYAARGVISTSGEGEAVAHNLDGVDIALVAGKGLCGLTSANIPMLGMSVDRTSHEGAVVRQQ